MDIASVPFYQISRDYESTAQPRGVPGSRFTLPISVPALLPFTYILCVFMLQKLIESLPAPAAPGQEESDEVKADREKQVGGWRARGCVHGSVRGIA